MVEKKDMRYLSENRHIPSEIEAHIQNTKELHPYFESSFHGIKPKNYCGFLFIDNQSYFIVPKIADDNRQNLNTFICAVL